MRSGPIISMPKVKNCPKCGKRMIALTRRIGKYADRMRVGFWCMDNHGKHGALFIVHYPHQEEYAQYWLERVRE